MSPLQPFLHPHYMTVTCPQPLWAILGRPLPLLPRPPDIRKGYQKRTKEKTKERYTLGRARAVLLALLPQGLVSVPVLIHSSPRRLRRRPTPHPRALQKLHHRPDSVVLPEPSQRWRPRVFPSTILSHSPPQLPNLGPPRSTLREQMVTRLPPAAVTPPTLVGLQPLGARHPIVEEGADRRVAGKLLVVALGNRLAYLSHRPPPEAGASWWDVSSLWPDLACARLYLEQIRMS